MIKNPAHLLIKHQERTEIAMNNLYENENGIVPAEECDLDKEMKEIYASVNNEAGFILPTKPESPIAPAAPAAMPFTPSIPFAKAPAKENLPESPAAAMPMPFVPAMTIANAPAEEALPESPQKPEWEFARYSLNKNRKSYPVAVILSLIMTFVFIAGITSSFFFAFSESGEALGQRLISQSRNQNLSYSSLLQHDTPDYADILSAPQVAQKVIPSVVGVVCYSSSTSKTPISEGSGVVMSADGYIITNAHVVEGTARVEVVFSDKSKLPVEVVGSDARNDLAVLKADATNLIPAEFGKSEQLLVAESIMTVGNPGGLEFASTVTKGIVSALDRTVKMQSGYKMKFIQIDAAISPGNSGGALVNMYGQVVGINTGKIMDVSYEGIGFAIPITEAGPIIDDLIKNGGVTTRPWIGIIFLAYEGSGQNDPSGIQIINVDKLSNAYSAGIRKDDIVTEINDYPVFDSDDISFVMEDAKIGDTITMKYFRGGSYHTVKIVLTASSPTKDWLYDE